jgi:uncharacterized protein YegL
MAGQPLKQLTDAVAQFKAEMARDVIARRRVEVSVITFNDHAVVHSPFVTVDEFVPPSLVARGKTSMGAAIELALEELAARKEHYKRGGVPSYCPWLIVMTDGHATDPENLPAATALLRERTSRKAVVPLMVPIGDGVDLDQLNNIAPNAVRRLKGHNFLEFMRWLSASMAQVSRSAPGDRLALPPAGGWTIDT